MSLGRPTIRTPETDAKIIEWISEGKTLRDFCRQPDTPAWRTVYLWLEQDEDFSARFARARELGFDAIACEALEIADTPEAGEIVTVDKDGTKTVTEDMLGHRKLRVETRLKLLAKWDPKRYGEKLGLGSAEGMVPLVLSSTDAKL